MGTGRTSNHNYHKRRIKEPKAKGICATAQKRKQENSMNSMNSMKTKKALLDPITLIVLIAVISALIMLFQKIGIL